MSLVLAGIAVHALAQTLLMLLKLTADPEKELASIEYWIMGSLAAVTRSRVWFPVPSCWSAAQRSLRCTGRRCCSRSRRARPGCSACGWVRCVCCC
ncbi:iron ABC transporter permease [Gemmiger formicilis]|nr:iron ABC transporter permease [Gemmiger formicilis]